MSELLEKGRNAVFSPIIGYTFVDFFSLEEVDYEHNDQS
jgi:hypothetical protein|tara:strand:- start:381 stop:497 length:117 start_codon:yes stop_codon:yes gene_type:complete